VPCVEGLANGSFFEKPFIGFLTSFDISLAELEHAIEEPRKFVGSGVDSRRGSKPDFNASDEGSDGSFALHGALSSQAQGSSCTISILSGFA
jgi:hypothetical protein